MRSLRIFSAVLTTVLALLSALLTYAREASAGAPLTAIRAWASSQSDALVLSVFVLSALAPTVEWVYAYVTSRNENKESIQRLLDDFSARHFGEAARRNRLTLFKATPGWRQFWWGWHYVLTTFHWRKLKAVSRIRFAARYLAVYVRAAECRHRRSPVALQISDRPHECEGMAGRVWEEGTCRLANLPKIQAADVRAVTDIAALPPDSSVRKYAEATNVRDIRLLHSMENFAQHFAGCRVRRNDGSQWGVLLLDSEDEQCPFPTARNARNSKLIREMQDLAVVLSKLIP